MNIGIDLIVSNLYMPFEWIFIFLVAALGILFYASDIRIGLLLHFFGFAMLFVWFYIAGLLWQPALVLTFLCLVLLSLSIYATSKAAKTQGAFI